MKSSEIILIDSAATRVQAAKAVAAGKIIAFRTDTFYGLGVDPFNRVALRAVKRLKGREADKPLLVIISDAGEADRFVAEKSPAFEALRTHHWPGPLTLVAGARLEVPEELTARTNTIGVRLPNDERVCEFVRLCGGALTATSANRAGKPPAQTAEQVVNYFTEGDVLVIDSGEAHGNEPSTVIDVSSSIARLIREGAIPRRMLEQTLHTMNVKLIKG